jgi:hypothetical protein
MSWLAMRWIASSVCCRYLHALHETADLLRKLRSARGEIAHLVGDDSETAAGFARTRGFDGGVERQQVGLLGNGTDLGQDALDIPCTRSDAVGELDELHAQLAVVDDAIDDTLHDFGGVMHELVEAHFRLPVGRGGTGSNRDSKLPLLVGLVVHAVETDGELVYRPGEQRLNPIDFTLYGVVLCSEFLHALDQQAMELVHQQTPLVSTRLRRQGAGRG